MIHGYPKFDALSLMEFSVSFLGSTIKLEGKAAFVHQSTGDTHGWTSCTIWSPDTIAKLKELRALMEIDLGMQHFQGGGTSVTMPAGTHFARPDVTGLGEHLGDEDPNP